MLFGAKKHLTSLIRQERIHRGLSQRQFAKEVLRVHQTRVVQLESEDGPPPTLDCLMEMLGKLGYQFEISLKKLG